MAADQTTRDWPCDFLTDIAADPEGEAVITSKQAKALLTELERVRGQNARFLRRLERAGLLGEPVEALNGEEQLRG